MFMASCLLHWFLRRFWQFPCRFLKLFSRLHSETHFICYSALVCHWVLVAGSFSFLMLTLSDVFCFCFILHQSSLKVALTSLWSVFVPVPPYDVDFSEEFCACFYRWYNQFDFCWDYALKFHWMKSGLRLFRAMSKLLCKPFCVELRCLLAPGRFAWRIQEDVHHCSCWSPFQINPCFQRIWGMHYLSWH